MATNHIEEQATQVRLRDIFPFDDDILTAVAEVAETQNRQSLAQLRAPFPEVQHFKAAHNKWLPVLDIVPGEVENVLVLHPPMGGSLNADRQVRAMTLARAMPTTRLITVGNAGEAGQGGGKLHAWDLSTVARGELRPTIDATMRYLASQHVETASHSGPSFGADKAVTAAKEAFRYDQRASQLVAVDPASVQKRSILELKRAFEKTGQALPGYVSASNCPAYDEARGLSSMRAYELGLLRASNLAIEVALTRNGFEDRLKAAIANNVSMKAAILWGENSELCLNEEMAKIVARNGAYGAVMPGQRHAMTNDIYLNAALVMQGLRHGIVPPRTATASLAA